MKTFKEFQQYYFKIYGEDHQKDDRKLILSELQKYQPDYIAYELLYDYKSFNQTQIKYDYDHCSLDPLSNKCTPDTKDIFKIASELNLKGLVGLDIPKINPKLSLQDQFKLRELYMVKILKSLYNKGNVIAIVGDTHLRTIKTKELGESSYIISEFSSIYPNIEIIRSNHKEIL